MLTTIIKKLNLNSLRKLQLEKDFKRFGHTLSIKATEEIFGGIFNITSEGDAFAEGMYYVAELLKAYGEENSNEVFKSMAQNIYQELYRNIDLDQALYLSIINMEPKRFLKKLFAPLLNLFFNKFPDNYVYIQPVVREGHVFYTAFNEKCIAVCNRGQFKSDNLFGNKLFIRKNSMFKMINIYNDVIFSNFKSQDSAENYINGIIDNNYKNIAFDFKFQKTGTCSYANIKSLIKPMLYMLGDSSPNDELKLRDFGQSEEKKRNCNTIYKNFSLWAKTNEVKVLLNKYIKARDGNDIAAAEVYRNLICQYSSRICTQELNKKNQVILKIIYNSLKNDKDTDLKKLLEDIQQKYNFNEEQYDITDLENKNHINPPNFLFITKILPWCRLLVLLPLQTIFPLPVLIFIFAGLALRALFTVQSGNKHSVHECDNTLMPVSNTQIDDLLSSKREFILSNIFSARNSENIKESDSLHSIGRNERNLNCYKYKY